MSSSNVEINLESKVVFAVQDDEDGQLSIFKDVGDYRGNKDSVTGFIYIPIIRTLPTIGVEDKYLLAICIDDLRAIFSLALDLADCTDGEPIDGD
jgi:hypothetical protein